MAASFSCLACLVLSGRQGKGLQASKTCLIYDRDEEDGDIAATLPLEVEKLMLQTPKLNFTILQLLLPLSYIGIPPRQCSYHSPYNTIVISLTWSEPASRGDLAAG